MKLLISGGTGSIGQLLTKELYSRYDKIVIYSRDEAKHQVMERAFPEYPDNKMRYMIGDIKDRNRLNYAMQGCDHVIHAAAMKHIDKCEYNPTEAINTNVTGSVNVADACIRNKVKHAMYISTDKACAPISLYGATKYVAESMWKCYNNLGSTVFNSVRYGNVLGSRGSILKHWKDTHAEGKPLIITHESATRFFWTIEMAGKFLIKSMDDSIAYGERGCVYIPKMQSWKIKDMAEKISKSLLVTGFRCPEKVHEDLITVAEAQNCYDAGEYYILYPMQHDWSKDVKCRGIKVPDDFSHNSLKNVEDCNVSTNG